jgi:hypothetical protein
MIWKSDIEGKHYRQEEDPVNYCLTPSQVEIVEWMVLQVRSGSLAEEMWISHKIGSESLLVAGHSGPIPAGLTAGAL